MGSPSSVFTISVRSTNSSASPFIQSYPNDLNRHTHRTSRPTILFIARSSTIEYPDDPRCGRYGRLIQADWYHPIVLLWLLPFMTWNNRKSLVDRNTGFLAALGLHGISRKSLHCARV